MEPSHHHPGFSYLRSGIQLSQKVFPTVIDNTPGIALREIMPSKKRWMSSSLESSLNFSKTMCSTTIILLSQRLASRSRPSERFYADIFVCPCSVVDNRVTTSASPPALCRCRMPSCTSPTFQACPLRLLSEMIRLMVFLDQ